MKTFAILAIIGSASAGLGEKAWTACFDDSDCGDYTCCSVTKDGQSPTKLCGKSGPVPLGSPADAYDLGIAVCPTK